MRRAFLAALIVAVGCTGFFPRRAQPPIRIGTSKMPGDERTTQRTKVVEPGGTYVARKRVKSKEEPATLISDDNSRCVVNEKRFKDTAVGDWATCPWTQ